MNSTSPQRNRYSVFVVVVVVVAVVAVCKMSMFFRTFLFCGKTD